MPKLRFVAAAVGLCAVCSWACAGGDAAPDASDSDGTQPLAQPEQPRAASPAQLTDDADPEVLGGGDKPIIEGSNTNWRPTEPWLEIARRPQAQERPDPRKPQGGPQSNTDSTPDPGQPSTRPAQPGESSSSSSSSGSNDSTPSPD
jgi:hypothetical protein